MSANPVLIQVLAGATVNITNDGSDAIVVSATDTDTSGPMSSEQRKALFGTWREAFGDGSQQVDRHLFTKAVLGDRISDPSWAVGGEITRDKAKHLLTVLGVVATLV